MRHGVMAIAIVALLAAPIAAHAGASSHRTVSRSFVCSSGYVDARLSWGEKCLRVGQFCKVGNIEYRRYGFNCPASGHLVDYAPAAPVTTTASSPSTPVPLPAPVQGATAPADVGRTVLLSRRTRTAACRRSAVPDRRCSPGAYYSGLTKAVICSSTFRTSTIRDVPDSEKFVDEREYGMPMRHYGRTIEIDHIVSLELGGSNSIANLFPEPGTGTASYRVKDRLENRLHDMVCSGAISLRDAQRQIAGNWEKLYVRIFGSAP